ncbi:GNAT family N-acetyltransferase [Candidatus Bathyarchaeota archaeon]|nr:GNAT family N-acetyltransferase [Candidatus Bathyarchaeota archaeon]MBS7630636.1 GNAT family N-acetyltransferase [Candidatus Bathyarchaeota archaeon]
MEINFETLPENYTFFFFRDLYDRFPKTFLVAEVDGSIQGYIMCRVETGLSKFQTLKPTRLLHVVSIAVREPYRRMGIGTNLLIQAIKNGKREYKATECYLEVRVTNNSAISLYEKIGFIKLKKNLGYYMDGEDAWVMAKPIVDKE